MVTENEKKIKKRFSITVNSFGDGKSCVRTN